MSTSCELERAEALLGRLRTCHGLTVTLTDFGWICAEPAHKVTDPIRSAIRANRDGLFELLAGEFAERWIESLRLPRRVAR